jgi:hypothetical protein
MLKEIERLVLHEGFAVFAGSWSAGAVSFSKKSPPALGSLRKALCQAPADDWAGFQIYYPMERKEVQQCTGVDLIDSLLAVFDEVTPAMNLCAQVQLVH